jgi:hypothetical protein
LEVQRLRAFDNKVISYAARLKEIWISEKYRREKYRQRDADARASLYQSMAAQVRELIVALDSSDFIESELLNCREQYLNAGRVLALAYTALETGDEAEAHLKEFSYYLDNASGELNKLWKEQGNRK